MKVREDQPVFRDGTVDLQVWLQRVENKTVIVDSEELMRACRIARTAEEESDYRANDWGDNASAFKTGLEMAEILADLGLDQDAIMAAVLYRTVREEELPLDTVKDQFGPKVAKLIMGVARMAAIHQQNSTKKSVFGQPETQGEAIRKMLVAMIDDVRVALIKLAERTCAIRAVKQAPAARRYKVAREVFDVYAPLAHRLGVGHLKWELEDLAFRYLEPQDYKKIAGLLDEKRLDRQEYIQKVQHIIQAEISRAHIDGEVQGRAKHIYSIWRKMKRKNISFSQVYDIRAFRILVPEVRDCYTLLGIVHSLWRHIPREFDDYIASPKQNGYRSLHTAVIGPEGKVVEIQIRTRDMHDDAELGVCAHWLYKGTDAKKIGGSTRGYEEKVAWLRQVLEWHDELGGIDEMVEELGVDVTVDRIYVLTPDGHVVDLAANATPVDFAYKVHTDIGHRCRGAKVNGRIVPLNTRLKIGDQIEILTGTEPSPSRDWLNGDLGYVNSSRAKAKIRYWFKSQDRDINVRDGKEMLLKELRRFNIDKVDLERLAESVNFPGEENLFAAIGAGDVRLMTVVHHAEDIVHPAKEKEIQIQAPKEQNHSGDLVIQGVGNLLTTIANCCKPVPGDTVVGYVTVGRGVSIHREDCVNLLQLRSREPERILDVSWGGTVRTTYPVELLIVAYDRTGLLKDMMTVLANNGVNVIGMNTLSNKNDNSAEMKVTIEVEHLQELGRVMAMLSKVPNVADVRRLYDKATKH